jgi:hypothetical protein
MVDLTRVDLVKVFDPDRMFPTRDEALRGFGARVDRARAEHDARGLAEAAALLLRVERESGRKSRDVTAAGLVDEAVRLAERLRDGVALAQAAQVYAEVYGPAGARPLYEKASLLRAAPAGPSRGVCRLLVRNLTSHTARLYADGQYLGTIDPDDTRYINVGDGYAELYARATCHPLEWGPSTYRLGSDFSWRLTP